MKYRTILIQGALDIEIQYLIDNLENKENLIISGYEFFIGYIKNFKIIISKTLIGVVNSTISTTIGILKFNPNIVINQGIAGSHKNNIHIGDIIIGEKCCNINAYSMPSKGKNEGSNPLEWKPNKRAEEIQFGNTELVTSLKDFLSLNYKKQIFVGTLGSGDVFNREIDRIDWLNDRFGNLCEDMESIGTYTVCNRFNIPCVGIRIISNNEITNEILDKEQAVILQKLLTNFLNDKNNISILL